MTQEHERGMSDERRRERVHRRRVWATAAAAVVLGWAVPAVSLTTVPYVFQPGTPARASEINANFAALASAIDAVEAATNARLATLETRGDFVPSGTIAFFATSACPSGWTQYTEANGRYVVAVTGGSSTGGTVGGALTDLEDRAHTHTIAHRHAWARFHEPTRRWFSYLTPDPTVGEVQILDWGSGIGNNSGRYPLEYERSGTLYTGNPSEDRSGNARTGDVAPYIQLRACQKN